MIEVGISNPFIDPFTDTKIVTPANFLIDTGADRTMVPLKTIITAGVPRTFYHGTQRIKTWNNSYRYCRLYCIDIAIKNHTIHYVEVAAIEDVASCGLLGRDVLNRIHLTFDGPRQVFSVTVHL